MDAERTSSPGGVRTVSFPTEWFDGRPSLTGEAVTTVDVTLDGGPVYRRFEASASGLDPEAVHSAFAFGDLTPDDEPTDEAFGPEHVRNG